MLLAELPAAAEKKSALLPVGRGRASGHPALVAGMHKRQRHHLCSLHLCPEDGWPSQGSRCRLGSLAQDVPAMLRLAAACLQQQRHHPCCLQQTCLRLALAVGEQDWLSQSSWPTCACSSIRCFARGAKALDASRAGCSWCSRRRHCGSTCKLTAPGLVVAGCSHAQLSTRLGCVQELRVCWAHLRLQLCLAACPQHQRFQSWQVGLLQTRL